MNNNRDIPWSTERKEKEENNNNNNKKRSKNNKSPKLCLGDLIILIAVSATRNLSY
jgi:hypothetical protein